MLGSATSKGAWGPGEPLHHINYPEMLAVYLVLEAFQASFNLIALVTQNNPRGEGHRTDITVAKCPINR